MEKSNKIEQNIHSGYQRLEDQIQWYDAKSISAKKYFTRTEIAEIFFAVMVPFMASKNATITAFLGMAIAIIEGLQQLLQWSQNWNSYRSTCEALRHEKFSYLGKSGVYEGKTEEEAFRDLTQRVESLISTEHAKWISRQEYDTKKTKNTIQ